MASQVKRVKLDDFTEGISEFAFNFYQECAKLKTGNLIISPLSVASALTLLSQGTNGKTYNEIKKALHLNPDKVIAANNFSEYYNLLKNSVGKSTLSIANHLYVKQGYKLNENFKKIAVEKFSSGIESLDFNDSNKSARTINAFVEANTNRMIKDFIKPQMLNSDTRLVLVNAIYFKGTWKYQFNKLATRNGDFHINETVKNRVEYMTIKKCFDYGELDGLDAKALEIKYADSNFSFLIILPNSRSGLLALEGKIENYKLNDITSQMRLTTCSVTIPKFKAEFEIDLESVLKTLGMAEMFDTKSANFTDLLEANEQLYVSDVIHKAIIEVNEEGSEAAAATGVMPVCCSGRRIPNYTIFRVDHAFLFHIIDKESNTIIFSGRGENLKTQTN